MAEETVRRIAVLYADVSGSTRLYEQHGDRAAREAIGACLGLLSAVAARLGGRTVKTIGDEVECVFPSPVKAAVAASEMQLALREASAAGRFETGPLRIKVGLHYGAASWRGEALSGEAVVTAQQVIGMAKADEVLTSAETLAALPPAHRAGARFVDRLEAEAYGGDLEVWALPWEESDERTQVARPDAPAGVVTHTALVLERDGFHLRVDDAHPHARLGRAEDNDVRLDARFASRHHARIDLRHGRFHLRDDSTNGTVVIAGDGSPTHLHREETMLAGTGRIGLGATPADDPHGWVAFRCE